MRVCDCSLAAAPASRIGSEPRLLSNLELPRLRDAKLPRFELLVDTHHELPRRAKIEPLLLPALLLSPLPTLLLPRGDASEKSEARATS